MALTLMFEGRPLRSRDHREMMRRKPGVVPGRTEVIADDVRALRATAADLRDLALRTSRGAEAREPKLILYRDGLQHLAAKGHLPASSVHAGEEIRDIYQMLMSVGCIGSGMEVMMVRLPTGDLVPAQYGLPVVERYWPWKAWAEGVFINRSKSVNLFELTIRVCVQGLGPQQVATKCGVRRTRAIDLFRNSLWRYAYLAGWVEHDIVMDAEELFEAA